MIPQIDGLSTSNAGPAPRLYRRIGVLPAKAPEFEIDMRYSLRTTLRP